MLGWGEGLEISEGQGMRRELQERGRALEMRRLW